MIDIIPIDQSSCLRMAYTLRCEIHSRAMTVGSAVKAESKAVGRTAVDMFREHMQNHG